MKHAGMKTRYDVIAPDAAVGFQKFTDTLKKLVGLPKSAIEKPKRRTKKK